MPPATSPAPSTFRCANLADNTDQIPTDEPVFVYCQSGWRAALATGALHNMGYENVRSFPPSFAGWEAAGEEIEK